MLGLPKDPMMLFSVINAHLRDTYPSLDALCDDMHVEKQQIIDKLAAVGYEYNEDKNKFWKQHDKHGAALPHAALHRHSYHDRSDGYGCA